MDQGLHKRPSLKWLTRSRVLVGEWFPAIWVNEEEGEDEHLTDRNEVWNAISPVHAGDVGGWFDDIVPVEP
jgi:hypothetical protein